MTLVGVPCAITLKILNLKKVSINPMQNENYFIPLNPSINPASFTSCTGKDCSRKNCHRHPVNNPRPYNSGNLYLGCTSYLKEETESESKKE